ncbi:MAG: flagellar hook-associated protein 3 [Halieaceae bacterium]|jgi:flagellar hook-associated protein 3 FlgL|nr:flagellar hook-associated protein 3 [Halieaceae bacterium]|tara:strand:+ start:2506 stop:3390 length:885 start_codon:yes stop_codon:yes gene_type:complete
MRISTAQYYKTNADQLQARQNKVAEVQAKLGSGKQLLHPSENPSKADLISRLESGKERQAVYSKNVDAAQTRLTSEEAVLTSMTQIMQRITELTVQGGNDTLAAEDRAVIAAEVKALRDELLNLANTQDINGNYIFSGNKVQAPAFLENSSGVVTYNGDYGRLQINVSDVRRLSINTIGPELFSTADFAALDDLVTKLNGDNGSGIRGSISEVEAISNKLTVSYGTMASRVAAIESQRTIIEDTELRIDELLLREDDLDYATAVTELTQESVALQALQASFAKLSQLTLFNFIR